MALIANILGSPSPNDLQTLECLSKRDLKWFKGQPIIRLPSLLRKMMDEVDIPLFDIIIKLVRWNPKDRMTAQDVLAHKYFKVDMRKKRVAFPPGSRRIYPYPAGTVQNRVSSSEYPQGRCGLSQKGGIQVMMGQYSLTQRADENVMAHANVNTGQIMQVSKGRSQDNSFPGIHRDNVSTPVPFLVNEERVDQDLRKLNLMQENSTNSRIDSVARPRFPTNSCGSCPNSMDDRAAPANRQSIHQNEWICNLESSGSTENIYQSGKFANLQNAWSNKRNSMSGMITNASISQRVKQEEQHPNGKCFFNHTTREDFVSNATAAVMNRHRRQWSSTRTAFVNQSQSSQHQTGHVNQNRKNTLFMNQRSSQQNVGQLSKYSVSFPGQQTLQIGSSKDAVDLAIRGREKYALPNRHQMNQCNGISNVGSEKMHHEFELNKSFGHGSPQGGSAGQGSEALCFQEDGVNRTTFQDGGLYQLKRSNLEQVIETSERDSVQYQGRPSVRCSYLPGRGPCQENQDRQAASRAEFSNRAHHGEQRIYSNPFQHVVDCQISSPRMNRSLGFTSEVWRNDCNGNDPGMGEQGQAMHFCGSQSKDLAHLNQYQIDHGSFEQGYSTNLLAGQHNSDDQTSLLAGRRSVENSRHFNDCLFEQNQAVGRGFSDSNADRKKDLGSGQYFQSRETDEGARKRDRSNSLQFMARRRFGRGSYMH